MAAQEMSAMSANDLSRVMVSFPVGQGDERIVERMHAIVQGDGVYLLDNSPFYTYDISCGDVFSATPEEGELVFSGVISRGGHSTYRIRLPAGKGHDFFLEHWSGLEAMGCTYEGSSASPQRLYSIDVPPGVNVFEVYRLLEQGEQDGFWSFEEGHYCRPKDS